MKSRWSCLFTLMLSSCAVHGPGPTDVGYPEAVKRFSSAKEAEYILTASWFPNIVLGSVESFGAASSPGRLFITPERLVFAVYDDATNTFLKSFEASYSSIAWVTAKEHGLSRILRLQTNNTVHSFVFATGERPTGQPADKDHVVKYVLGKFQ